MLLIDTILMSPARGLMFVLREINKAVQAERAADERAAMAELTELHRAFDRGQMSEEEFDAREQQLLTRLERLQGGHDGEDVGDGHS